MKTTVHGHRSENGMALLIALVVLVVVSILGAASMRSALFQGRISVNQQASQVMFQGAESGIESVFSMSLQQMEDDIQPQNPAHIFYRAVIDGVPQRICYDEDGALTVEEDVTRTLSGDDVVFDYDDCEQRGDNPLIVTAIVSAPPPGLAQALPLEGTSLCGNNTTCYGTTQIYSQSFASISGLNYLKSHVQMWGILSPSSGN